MRDNHGGVSTPASLRIDPGDRAPEVTIDTPTSAARFAVGDTITLHATATDPEDGTLAPSSLSWRVLRHHDSHTHPFLAPTPGNDLTIQQPSPEDLGSGIDGYLEIQLTATDSAGVTTTVTRDVLPKKVSLTFAANPTGRTVVVAGTTYVAPTTLTSWQGYTIAVDAPAQTDGSGASWVFQSWSDGGAAAHSFATPATATTYTATFVQSAAPAGLVAAFGFDAGSGSVAVDSSGRGNAGSVSGATWSSSGRFGSALSFDGVNDWVTVADAGFARPDVRDDGRGVGASVEAGWVADGGVEGAYGWGRVRAGCGCGRGAAVGSGGHRWRAERGWVGGVAVERLVASGGDVRRGGRAVVRERGAGGLVAVRGLDGGVDGSVAAGRERHLG